MANGTGHEFMVKTRYPYLGESDQMKRLPPPPLEMAPDPDKPIHALPDPKEFQGDKIGLREAIERRVSVRSYADELMSLAELSYSLWCTQGVKRVVAPVATLRTTPSAGARHAFETFLLVNRVEGLTPGIYRYLAIEHQLIEVALGASIAAKVTAGCWGQKFVETAAVTFIWVAIPYRMNWRYQERGYRYLLLDAGHVCQNLYLMAEDIGCGVCAIAAYDDEALNELLGLDGREQFVIYIATLGKKPIT